MSLYNLMVWFSPDKSFGENEGLARAQIDLANALRWRTNKVILITNFEWEYGGIRTTVLDNLDFPRNYRACKLKAFIAMRDAGMLEKGHIYWFHDFDVYQCRNFAPPKIRCFGATRFARHSNLWSTGSIFFTHEISDMLDIWLAKTDAKAEWCEERALNYLSFADSIIDDIGLTYNYRCKQWNEQWPVIEKPICALHGRIAPAHMDFWTGNNPAGENFLWRGTEEIFRKNGLLQGENYG